MLICVTNRKLCHDDFLQRIRQLAKEKPHAIMLREKDLPLENYEALAIKVNEICEEYQVPLIINQNISIAANRRIQRGLNKGEAMNALARAIFLWETWGT